MNVLFIFSDSDTAPASRSKSGMPKLNSITIQLGISYISSLLKIHNYNTDLLVLNEEVKRSSIDKFINKFRPGLICFTAVFKEYEFISKIARYIKFRYPSIYLLIGGVHASLNPQEVIRDSFDALCVGEGEYPTLELVRQLEKGEKVKGISNLWIKNKKRIEKNPTRDFIGNLNNLPFPDRIIWQKWITPREPKEYVILAGRGCPFQCSYCCNHALNKIASGKFVRQRSPNNIVEELQKILIEFPETNRIYFEIESIDINREFAIKLCSKLKDFNKKHKKPLTYGTNLRIKPKTDYNNLFRVLSEGNFSFINVGIESGSMIIREKTLKRYYSNQDILRVARLAKKSGIKINVYVMLGIPGETLTDFRKTIRCVRQCCPDKAQISICFPYPGTELHKLCREKELLNKKFSPKMERMKAIFDLPGFSRKQIQEEFYFAPYSFNLISNFLAIQKKG